MCICINESVWITEERKLSVDSELLLHLSGGDND